MNAKLGSIFSTNVCSLIANGLSYRQRLNMLNALPFTVSNVSDPHQAVPLPSHVLAATQGCLVTAERIAKY